MTRFLPMKTIFLILILSAAVLSQTVSYDKFKDETTVTVAKGRLVSSATKRNWLWVTGAFTYKGTALTADATDFLLVFSTEGYTRWQFLYSHSLILLIDGERIPAGDG